LIVFIDVLRRGMNAWADYSALKSDLASKHQNDCNLCTNAKTGSADDLSADALACNIVSTRTVTRRKAELGWRGVDFRSVPVTRRPG